MRLQRLKYRDRRVRIRRRMCGPPQIASELSVVAFLLGSRYLHLTVLRLLVPSIITRLVSFRLLFICA